MKEKKSIYFQNKRARNLETLGGTRKKYGTLLESSSLKSYGKLSRLSPKNWVSLYEKNEKYRFAANKEA